MKTPADRDRHDVALFRYGLIADIMTLPPGAERAAAVRARADRAQPRPAHGTHFVLDLLIPLC